MIELMIQVFIEVRITYLSQHNQLPAVLLCLWHLSHLLPSVKDKVRLSHPLPAYSLLSCVVRGSFQKRVLNRRIEKVKKVKKMKTAQKFLQKIKMISAGKALAPHGGHKKMIISRHDCHII